MTTEPKIPTTWKPTRCLVQSPFSARLSTVGKKEPWKTPSALYVAICLKRPTLLKCPSKNSKPSKDGLITGPENVWAFKLRRKSSGVVLHLLREFSGNEKMGIHI